MATHSPDSVSSSAPASEPKPSSVPVGHVAGQPDTDIKMVLSPDGNSQPTQEYVTGVKLAVIVAAVAFASFLILLDTMIVSTAIPSITDTFHSLPGIGWYASVYQFGTAAPQLLTGRIYTYFSTKWTFLVFFGIFEIGSTLCGVGFYVNLPAGGLAAIAIILLRLQREAEKPNPWSLIPKLHHHLDLVGFFLIAPATLELLLALQFGGVNYPWNLLQNALILRALIGRGSVLAFGLHTALLIPAVYGAIYFLPLYFQAVNGASALLSAVYLLPMILAQTFTAGAAGAAVTKIGYVIPVAIFSAIFLSVGSGLYSILQPGSSTGKWVGFQILGGIGSGAGLQLAITNVQVAMGGEELASGISFCMFCQNLGPTIALTLMNVIFGSTLPKELRQHAPLVDPAAVVSARSTDFHTIVPPNELPGVLVAYANSINHVFYLVAGFAAAAGIALWGMGWHDLRIKKDQGRIPSLAHNTLTFVNILPVGVVVRVDG
ncbi:MFS general substrate transporter [Annulohypoxylon truncatum]|uniref:MFS general substrate transporter n=1 Tax=Annulohypoxylon truncatum TaxID=327061 RepID=UPI002008B69E|nr:MFS general substrate transporter [Annulohypoxylon truncatum]KAI1210031.1 MFS general substrate transporter [Annulohypoxylon truncatum]